MKPELVTIQRIRLVQLGAVALAVCVLSFTIGYYYHGSGDGQPGAPGQGEAAKEPDRETERPIVKLIGPDPEKSGANIREDTAASATSISPPPPKMASVPPKRYVAPKQTRPKKRTVASKTAPKSTATSRAPKASISRKYTVQVASFQKAADAKRLKDSLKENNFPSYIKTVVIKGTRWNRVRVGSYGSIEKARKVGQRIDKQKRLKTMVVRYE